MFQFSVVITTHVQMQQWIGLHDFPWKHKIDKKLEENLVEIFF